MYHKTRTDKRLLLSKSFPTEHGIGICTYPLSKECSRRHHRNPLRGNRGEIVHGENAHHSDNLLPISHLLTFHLIRLHTYYYPPLSFFLLQTSQPFFRFSGRLKLCSCQLCPRTSGISLRKPVYRMPNLTTTCRQGCIRHRWPTCSKADATAECEKVVPKGFAQSGREL